MHNIFYLDGHNVVKVHIMHIFFDVVSANGELQHLSNQTFLLYLMDIKEIVLLKRSTFK